MNEPLKQELPFVLIVEDHESQRHLYRLLSDRLNFSAHIVDNAFEALEALETYKFDVILMDIRMPEMDGMQCAKKIREAEKATHQHIPIIAVTACVFQGDKEKILASGIDDYLSKPFSLDELKKIVFKWSSLKAS